MTFKGVLGEILGGRLGKWGWLTFFGILMAMVFGVAWLLGSAGGPWEIVTGLIFFLFLLLLMWLLHLRVNEWITEARYERSLRMKKTQLRDQRNINR
jgi:fatty acid desaturase